jgi:hypothetical protein
MQPASTAYWLNVSAATVERPGSDDRCPYSQGLVGYVANTSIVNNQYNRLPVITYISLVYNFIVRVTKPRIKDKIFEKRADIYIPYILESNPHPFYSFRGLKNQIRIRIACGLDSLSRAGFCKNDRALRTIIYYFIYYL